MYSISSNQILRLSFRVNIYFNNQIRRKLWGGFLNVTHKFGSSRLHLRKMDRYKIKLQDSVLKGGKNPRLKLRSFRSVINVEKSIKPNSYVQLFNVEDEILRELKGCRPNSDDRGRRGTPENKRFVEMNSKLEKWSTMTPVEYNQWRRTAAVKERSKPTVLQSSSWPIEDTLHQKRGLLAFFTHLSTLRQTRVPNVGFASSSTQPVDEVASTGKTNLTVGKDLKLKEGPFVKSSSQNRSEFIASLAPESFPAGSNTMGFKSTFQKLATSKTGETPDVKATPDPEPKATTKVSIDRISPRLDAEVKECSIMTRHRTLTDATTLIGPRTDTAAPQTLLKLRNHPDHSLEDPELRVLLKKYKKLKLKEIDYHHAQIKKHRKQLMDLMVKKPYQLQET